MSLEVVAAAVSFRALVREMDVGVMEGGLCVVVAEEMARVEKACAALRAMAAARAADCGAHRERGFNSAEDWLAGAAGSTRHQARSEIETGSRLGGCTQTRRAALEGDVSLSQAEEITRTEQEKPGSELEMIEKARTSTRQQLADACRRRRQEGVDRQQLARSQHAKRCVRSWTDADGMICGQFRFEPVVGVPLVTRFQAEADRLHRQARRTGSTEPWQAHGADALAAMMGGGPVRPYRTKADVVFVVDLATFRHGEHPQTVCHIVGGGPVDPEVVRAMAKDAFLKVVFHDGVNIHTVAHLGRYIPTELRTALEIGNPPEFDGITCSGCGKKFNLQWDHLDPVCAGGLTTYANEDPKCWECHAKKCDEERAAGLYSKPPPPRPELAGSVNDQR